MADRQELNEVQEEQRELRQAILGLTKSVESQTKYQEESNKSLEKRLDKTAKISESVVRIGNATVEGLGTAARTGTNIRRYGVTGGLGVAGMAMTNARVRAQFAPSQMSAMARMMMNAHPALRVAATLLGGAAGVLAIRKALRGGAAASNQSAEIRAQDAQMQYIRTTSIQAIRTNQLLETVVLQQRMAADPFQRGAGYNRLRMMQLNEDPTAYESNALNMRSAAAADAMTARAARERARQARRSSFGTIRDMVSTGYESVMGGLERRYNESTAARVGVSAIPLVGIRSAIELGSEGLIGRPDDLRSRAGRAAFMGRHNQRMQVGRQNSYDELIRRGPMTVAGYSPTVRAGTTGEYDFLLRQERDANNRERVQAWRDEVLLRLRTMVELGERGENGAEELRRTQIQLARPIEPVR